MERGQKKRKRAQFWDGEGALLRCVLADHRSTHSVCPLDNNRCGRGPGQRKSFRGFLTGNRGNPPTDSDKPFCHNCHQQQFQVFNLTSSSDAHKQTSINMRVLSTATAVLAFERGTVTSSSAFQVLVPSSGSGRSTAASRRLSSHEAFPWTAASSLRCVEWIFVARHDYHGRDNATAVVV